MRGNTDTEFLYVLLLSLLEGDGDEDVKRAFEEMFRLIVQAMEDLDLVALTKLKMALVSPKRIIGVNWGSGTRARLIRRATGESCENPVRAPATSRSPCSWSRCIC